MRSVARWLALCVVAAILQEISSILPEDEPEKGQLTSEPRHVSKRNSCHHQSCDPYYVTLRNALHFRGNPYYQHHPNYGGSARIYPGHRGGNIHVSPSLCSCPKLGSRDEEYTVVNTDDLVQKNKPNSSPNQCTEEKETVSHPKTNEKTVEDSSKNDKINSRDSSDLINNGNPDAEKRTGYLYESSGGIGHTSTLIVDGFGYPSVLRGNAGKVLVTTQDVSSADLGTITTQENNIKSLDESHNAPGKETADINNFPDLSNNDPSTNKPSPGQVIKSPSSVTSPALGISGDISKLGWNYNAQMYPNPVGYQGAAGEAQGPFSFSENYASTAGYQTVPQLVDSKGTTLTDTSVNQQVVAFHTKTESAEPFPTTSTKDSGHDLLNKQLSSKTSTWPQNIGHEKELGVYGGEANINKSTNNNINLYYCDPILIPTSHSSKPYAQQPEELTTKPNGVFDVSRVLSSPTSPTSQINSQYGYATLANRGTIPVAAQDTSSNNHPYLGTQGISQNTGMSYGYPTVLGENPPKKDSFGHKLNYSLDSLLTNDNQATKNGQKGMIIGKSSQTHNYPETLYGQPGNEYTSGDSNRKLLNTSGQLNIKTETNNGWTQNAGVPFERPTLQTTDQDTYLRKMYYTNEYGQVYTNKEEPQQTVYQPTDQPIYGQPPDQTTSYEGAPKLAVQGINTPTVSSTYLIPNTGDPSERPTLQTTDQRGIYYTNKYDQVYTNKEEPQQTVYQPTDQPIYGQPPDQTTSYEGAPKLAVQGINTPTVSSTYLIPNTGDPSERPTLQTTDQRGIYYTNKYDQVYTNKEEPQQTVYQPTDQPIYGQPPDQTTSYGGAPKLAVQDINTPTVSSTYLIPNTGDPSEIHQQTVYQPTDRLGAHGLTTGYEYELQYNDRSTAKNVLNFPLKYNYGYKHPTVMVGPYVSTPYDKTFIEGSQIPQVSKEGGIYLGNNVEGMKNIYEIKSMFDQTPGGSPSLDGKDMDGNGKSENLGMETAQSSSTTLSGNSKKELSTALGEGTPVESHPDAAVGLEVTSPAKLETATGTAGKQESTSLQVVKPDFTSDDVNDKVVTVGGYSMKQSQLNDIISSFKSPEKCTLTLPQVFSGRLDQYIHVINSYPASGKASDAFVQTPSDLLVPLYFYKAMASIFAPELTLFADESRTVLSSGHLVDSSTISNILASVKTPEEVIILTPTGHAVPFFIYCKYIDRISLKDKKMLKVVIRNEKDPLPYDMYMAVLNKYVSKSPVDPESKKGLIKLLCSNIEMPLIKFLSIMENHSKIKDATVNLPSGQVVSLEYFQSIAKIVGKDYTRKCIVNMPNTDTRIPYPLLEDIFRIYLGNKHVDFTKDTDVNFKFPTDENPNSFCDKLGDGSRPIFKTAGENGYSPYGGHDEKGYGHRGYPYHPRSRHFLTEAAEAVDRGSSCLYPRDFPLGSPEGESILDVLHPGHTGLMGYCPYIDHYCRSYQQKSKGKKIFER